jgi:DNA modification methylase
MYHSTEHFTLYHGDNREVLKQLPDNSIDSVVTDPPYELGFMGKKWDSTGIAYDVELWREVLRVLKPGGHLLAFSGSRTYHRMAVAIEDAGFDIRDQIMWIYGSGFPKSLDIGKALDKAAGVERTRVAYKGGIAPGHANYGGGQSVIFDGTKVDDIAITTEAKQWHGWGTALKPAHEPIVLARKPVTATFAANVLEWGVGGLNIDGTRVGNEGGTTRSGESTHISPSGAFTTGHQIAELNAGRWPANVIHDGSDEVVKLFPNTKGGVAIRHNSGGKNFGSDAEKPAMDDLGYGDSGSAARFFYCAKASKRDRNEGLDGFPLKLKPYGNREEHQIPEEGDPKGSVNDKFTTEPAANHHPTVKPTDLMAYLCRLVTPKGGTVLDPFMGSGSTGKAAMYEGFKFIGIEMTDEYLPIAKARIEFALDNREETLFNA